MRSIIIVFSLIIFSNGCDYITKEQRTLNIAKEVVTLIEQGNIEKAFEILKEYWPLSSVEVDDLKAHTIQQREKVVSRYGNPIGIEFIRTDVVGDSMIMHTFIEKFERHALKWQLSFYKPEKKWIINSVYWDDKISELYETT